ncbi:MAG: hypothetical protein LPJ98_15225, partial [Cyclobacteriaceae bacterium]|nr:hypothetical protein [Cyclobacteriaceae bacterium]
IELFLLLIDSWDKMLKSILSLRFYLHPHVLQKREPIPKLFPKLLFKEIILFPRHKSLALSQPHHYLQATTSRPDYFAESLLENDQA